MSQQHPISQALSQLRRGVGVCAVALAVSCVVQLLVFGFVHFTDVRWQTLKPAESARPLVVKASAPESTSVLRQPTVKADEPGSAGPPPPEPATKPAQVNRVESSAGVVLARSSEIATVVGVFAGLSLAALTLLGAIVAGGGAVPGVDKTVSACMWGLVVGMLTLPWRDIFVSMPFPGVFTSYQSMVSSSSTGGFTVLLVFIAVPMLGVTGAVLVASRFSAGVERGIIAANAPDAIDKDMAATLKAMGSTRQLGAVRNDFRKSVAAAAAPEPAPAPDPVPARREPEPIKRAAAEPPKRRRELNPTEEADWKRPI